MKQQEQKKQRGKMKPGVQGVNFLYAGKNKGIESVTGGMILIHRM